jgi:D-beta-D-heptose 7-phosphate kinase/D-beta-D-heptose 1-phosphate adenosyltransferase
VYDVSGAGDTVIAALAVGLSRGMDIEEAMAMANVAAGIVVGKHGTATVHLDELIASKNKASKVMSMTQLLAHVKQWRSHGLSIGFTNGCFDLIHPGHIHTIADAKRQCDRLIVGLNADASIKRLKGSGRPIQHEAARATVLGAMADVDAIVLFEEDTPLHLIEAIRPDVLIKGKDYTVDEVVGAKGVMAYGGRVHLVDTVKGHSTTNLINKNK